MKKLLFVLAFIAAPAWADRAVNLHEDSGPVSVSTIPMTPTRLFMRDSDSLRTVISNQSGYDLAIATSGVSISTNTILFSTSTAFIIPTGIIFELDSGNTPFVGELYGVIVGTDSPKRVQRYRSK
jgi:hypothetical protein